MNTSVILSSIFSPAQLTAIITIASVVGLLIIANWVLFYLIRKHQERRLCTTRLQEKRDALLDHLRNITDDGSLVSGGIVFSDVDEPEEEPDTEDEEEEDDEDSPEVMTEELGENEDITQNEILAVADMSEYTRRKLGYVGDEYDNKRYYVRYRYGFEAKLRAASDEVKERYTKIMGELALFKSIKIKTSFRGQRFYKGRKTLGQIYINGKTLCIAFALDPEAYADTKYHGIDKSDKKRFEKTPMMYRLTSTRRVEYARYLIMHLAEFNSIVPDYETQVEPVDLSPRTPDELFVAQALRIAVLGEAPELEGEAEPELILDENADEGASEAAVSADDESDELAIDTPEGRIVFDRSFTARIIQADDALKARYSELKNHILSYKGVKGRISWKRETFSIGRKTIAIFAVRGKTLMLYLATDPSRFEDTKYKVENMSEVASRRNTPLLFRIKGDRRTAYAKQLIDMLLEENGVAHVERKPQDYTLPYKSTDALVKRGLIKITTHNGFGFAQDKKQ